MTGRAGPISERLVARAREGGHEALRELVEAAYPSVRRWALVQTGHPADADDLAQDVMIKMIAKLETFQGDAGFESWLYALTRNAALDRHRREARRHRAATDPRTRDALTPVGPRGPSRVVEDAQLGSILMDYFRRLPDRQREVFDLVELQGRSAAEASDLMGIEPVSVRANLFKARRTLRSLVLAEHPELAEGCS